MSIKYREIIVGDDYDVKLFSGNLNEEYQGLLILKESIGNKTYQINFGKSTDFIDIYKRESETVEKVGLYLVLESPKIVEVQKRAYGLADHLDLKNYIVVTDNRILNIITHHPLDISVFEEDKEVDRWSIG